MQLIMRKIIFILCFLCICNELKSQCINGKTEDSAFSNIFKKYSEKFDTLVLLKINGFKMYRNPVKLLGTKNNSWIFVTIYPFDDGVSKDSLITKSGEEYLEIYKQLIKNHLQDIPTESALLVNCRSIKDTIINGTPAAIINDLALTSDLEEYKVEYKIGKLKRSITYISPFEAIKICPDSKERIDFIKIISILRNL